MKSLLVISAWIDRLNEQAGRLVCLLTPVMVLLGALNAIARYLGRYTGMQLSSNAYLEAQWYLFSLIFLFGAGYALRHNVHVRVDVLYERLSTRARARLNLAGALLFTLPFCLLLIVATWSAAHNAWAIREVSPDPGGLPRWPIKLAMPLAFVLLFLQGLSESIKDWAFLRGAAPNPEESAAEELEI